MQSSLRIRATVYLAALSILAVALGGIGYADYRSHEDQLLRRSSQLIETVLPLESLRIQRWELERESDLRYYALSPEARPLLRAAAAGTPSPVLRRRLDDWFGDALRLHEEYDSAAVVSRSGRVLWSLPAGAAPPSPALAAAARAASAPVIGGPHFSEGLVYIDEAAAVGKVVVVLRIKAWVTAYPSLVGASPRKDGSLDFVLARRSGAGAKVLDHDPSNPALSWVYSAPPDGAAALALARPGAAALGRSHLGRLVVAVAGAQVEGDWSLLATREVGSALTDAKATALVYALCGA
ncbi:MAG: hypothetical protein KGL53_13760, partial [Elusimicrobia bacterium]|nr:hypothetical protein [Elusimicrobiota bacterium]